ncbi:TrkH family potassium uptake protein [Bifidobacterium primatium]|uniref:TrkH family potassium uptake protein n=1 Tax=Bifidobacterium primatium TaxID=2045438 RepID=UPI001FAF2FBE|nr:potassium transporter TrkG [Bifidobacterium primatium]
MHNDGLRLFGGGSRNSQDSSPTALNKALIEKVASHPGRLSLAYFIVLILLATFLLAMPVSSRSGEFTDFNTAFFTAVSALSTCGIAIVNTAAYWTYFGQAVILIAIQLGGLGVMTFASLITMTISRRIRVSQKLLTADELGASKLSEVQSVIAVVLVCTFSVETVAFLMLLPGLLHINSGSLGNSLWEALFFAVASYNNAGFTPDSAGLYVNSWSVGLPILLSAFVGTLGFPVILNIFRCTKRLEGPRRWNLHTKLTMVTTLSMVTMSLVWFLLVEWNNQTLFWNSDISSKLWHSLVAAVMPRSAGFDISWMPHVSEQTKLFMSMVTFVGGGSASTAGGIRVTTLAVLVLVCRAAILRRKDDAVFGKRLHTQTVIMSIAITATCGAMVYIASLILLTITQRSLTDILFEVCSAFGLGGYTLGVADPANPGTLYVLAILMFVGRLGPMTVAYAISKPQPPQAVRYPAESIIVG